MQSFILVEGFGFPAFGKPKQKFYPNTKKMKNNSYFIFKLSIALLIIFASSFSYGQEIRNNNQTETIQLPVKKIVRYFDNFNLHYLTDYELTETKKILSLTIKILPHFILPKTKITNLL